MKPRRIFLKRAAVLGAGLLSSSDLSADATTAEEKTIPIILDTDIGTDVDDAFALALVLASPELDLRGVTTVGSEPRTRALMVCRFLTAIGRRDIPVAAGAAPQPAEEIEKQGRYANHPAVIFNRTAKPVKETAVELLYQQLKERRGELTLLPIGPLTNIARLLREASRLQAVDQTHRDDGRLGAPPVTTASRLRKWSGTSSATSRRRRPCSLPASRSSSRRSTPRRC